MNVQFSLSASSTTTITQKNPLNDLQSASQSASQSAVIETAADTHSVASIKDKSKGPEKPTVGEEHLIRIIDKAVKSLQGPQTILDISIHERTHEIMVKVLNKETGELIREVPPEKTLDIVANMMEIAGIIVDEKI